MKTMYTVIALWLASCSALAGPNIHVGLVYDY